MDKLTASWEALSNTIVNSDIIKFFISTVTAIVDAADAVAQFIGGAGALLSIAPIAISLYNNFAQVKNVVDGVAKAFTNFVGGAKRRPFEYAHCIVMVTLNEPIFTGKAIHSKWLGAYAPVNGVRKKHAPL